MPWQPVVAGSMVFEQCIPLDKGPLFSIRNYLRCRLVSSYPVQGTGSHFPVSAASLLPLQRSAPLAEVSGNISSNSQWSSAP